MPDPATLQDRLDLAFGHVAELLETCRVPSLSVGVLHQGEVVFTKSIGLRVVDQAVGGGKGDALPATPETAYLIASCSKIILACAVGILVDEGKMSWHDPIRKHVPDFSAVGDKRISQGATIRHAMCHTTGLGRQNPLIQGIKGNVLVDEDSFVALINHAPTHDTEQHQGGIQSSGAAEGQAHHSDSPGEMGRGGNEKEEEQARNSTTCNPGTFLPIDQDTIAKDDSNDSFQEREFVYNNYSMALVGLAVQNASGQRYSTFIQQRILEPLGMDGTIVTRCRMESHQNVAVGYVKLNDNTFSEVATEAQTDDAHTPILSVIGVRSSVDDMLKLTKAMISAYSCEIGQHKEHDKNKVTNPLRQVSTIWKTWAEIDEGLSYGMGCYKLAFPSPSFSSFGINSKTRSEEPEFFQSHVVGQDLLDSAQHMEDNVIAHIGYNNGFTSSVTIFPGTKTAIVAFANGMDLGDPADWSVKILAQALFQTTPQVDIIALAKKEAELWKRWFDNILIEWLADRRIMHQESDLAEYVGCYEGLATTIQISLNPETAHLTMEINSCEGSRFDLELYGYDTYSFMPLTKDEWLRNGMWDWDQYHVAVLYFHRDDDGKVFSFSWRYEADEEDGHFYRTWLVQPTSSR